MLPLFVIYSLVSALLLSQGGVAEEIRPDAGHIPSRLASQSATDIRAKERFSSTALAAHETNRDSLGSLILGRQTQRLVERMCGERTRGRVLSVYECVKVIGLLYVDDVLKKAPPRLPITDRACLVQNPVPGRWAHKDEGRAFPRTDLDDRLGDHVTDILSKDWSILVGDRLYHFLRRYSLQLRLDDGSRELEGRGRRRDQRMLALVVMGFMIMASILIPTGFQFLTVLGGKSLLMAKMALILSAISGLKKIATSNVGYGFYHAGTDGHHHHHHDHGHHGFHDKVYQMNPQQSAQFGLNL